MALPIIIAVLGVLLLIVLLWLSLVIADGFRRLHRNFNAMANTLDDIRRALQAATERLHSTEGSLDDGLKGTSAALAANGRALAAIRDAFEKWKRR
ncbi:MAG TPA: hypothetical protein VGZ29_12605 [Terriglobia bacterium]|nr:hypothetical protein [Terriglobia bacterium]